MTRPIGISQHYVTHCRSLAAYRAPPEDTCMVVLATGAGRGIMRQIMVLRSGNIVQCGRIQRIVVLYHRVVTKKCCMGVCNGACDKNTLDRF